MDTLRLRDDRAPGPVDRVPARIPADLPVRGEPQRRVIVHEDPLPRMVRPCANEPRSQESRGRLRRQQVGQGSHFIPSLSSFIMY